MSQSTKDKEMNMLEELVIKEQTYKDVISKVDIWQELESAFSGKLVVKKSKVDRLTTMVLSIPHGSHMIVVTESDTKPLKFESEFQLNTKFEFVLGPEDGIERILKFFGKQDVIIGNRDFDKKYMVQSNSPILIKKVLHPAQINQGIIKHKLSSISLQWQRKGELSKLLIVKDRNTSKKEVISGIIDLMRSLIDSMVKNQIIKKNYGLQH